MSQVMSNPTVQLKEVAGSTIDAERDRLVEVAQFIHANPELQFKEFKAAERLTAELERAGFKVERGIAGMETAFRATYGEGRPNVAIIAEYDALAGLGHACGHNLIATWALGAALGVRAAVERQPEIGRVTVIGAPAEEGGGGKVVLVNEGVFRGVDAAMMIHGRDRTFLDRGSLAVERAIVKYRGRPAHASSSPDQGINALDAVINVFVSVNALRQQLKPDVRVHGIITHGGDAPNIIPEFAEAKFLLRSQDQAYLDEVKAKFINICQAAALATGASVEIEWGLGYKQRKSSQAIARTFGENLAAQSYGWEAPPAGMGVGSSDIGDVSQVVPTIHPYLQICEPGVGGHTAGFREAAASERAMSTLPVGAKAMAWTAIDLMTRPKLLEEVRAEFRERMGRDPQA